MRPCVTGGELSAGERDSDQENGYAEIGVAADDLGAPADVQPQPEILEEPDAGGAEAVGAAQPGEHEDAVAAAGLDWARRPGHCEVRLGLPRGIGELRYNVTSDFFRAHCPHHGANCARRRAAFESNSERAGSSGQGRPLGLLIHWLQTANQFDSRESHIKARVGSHADRIAARAFFNTVAGAGEFSCYERKCGRGELEEPERIL